MSAKVTKFILVLVFIIPVYLNAAQVNQKGFRFDTPWLGVMLSDVSEKTLKNMGLENGVKISKVFKDSPADKAGLEIDDIIVSFGGEKVSNSKGLSNQVNMKKVNDEIDLKYFRDGKMNSTKVTIEKRKSPEVFMKKAPQIMKKKFHHSQNSVFLGVKVEPLSDQLREYFNVSNGLGVLVSEVIKDSPAEKAGMKAGDVIIKVEDREVKNYRDLTRGLNYFDPNDEVKIHFIREKKGKSVKVTLAEPNNELEKFMWIDEDDDMHEIDIDIPEIKNYDENEIEFKRDKLDRKIEIIKEIKVKDEV
jgi:S1-C subfamily serine protease